MNLSKVNEIAWTKYPCYVVGEKTTSERGVVRLEEWDEGFVLWYHGQIVWKSWKDVNGD